MADFGHFIPSDRGGQGGGASNLEGGQMPPYLPLMLQLGGAVDIGVSRCSETESYKFEKVLIPCPAAQTMVSPRKK